MAKRFTRDEGRRSPTTSGEAHAAPDGRIVDASASAVARVEHDPAHHRGPSRPAPSSARSGTGATDRRSRRCRSRSSRSLAATMRLRNLMHELGGDELARVGNPGRGQSSTTSKPTTLEWCRSGAARRSSAFHQVSPPGSGVPVAGTSDGSKPSMSMVTYTRSARPSTGRDRSSRSRRASCAKMTREVSRALHLRGDRGCECRPGRSGTSRAPAP